LGRIFDFTDCPCNFTSFRFKETLEESYERYSSYQESNTFNIIEHQVLLIKEEVLFDDAKDKA